jgi:hypothetical protein
MSATVPFPTDIATRFAIAGDWLDALPYGHGHINDTFAVRFNQAGTIVRYIFQRVNTRIFTQPEQLMENILRVTEHARAKRLGHPDASRQALTVVPADDGQPWARDTEGGFWRVYYFVEGTLSRDTVQSADEAYQAARAFGLFQKDLADLPAPRLHETIADFHHTPKRFAALEAAIAQDPCGRVAQCAPEIEFALARQPDASLLVDLLATGELPERITHNDTKLNNVLLNAADGQGLCVIDLDTVMPGLVHYDFGDMVRTATCTCAEDETDLSRIQVRFDLFEALLRGYLSAAADVLTPREREYLPFSGKLITLEIGVRFLTDYLSGDVYFKTRRPGHNLDRCRNQFQRVRSIEAQLDAMRQLLNRI